MTRRRVLTYYNFISLEKLAKDVEGTLERHEIISVSHSSRPEVDRDGSLTGRTEFSAMCVVVIKGK